MTCRTCGRNLCLCNDLERSYRPFAGYVPPMDAPPLRDGQTRVAEFQLKSTEPPLTEQRLREIIREELWRHDNPNRVYQRDLAAQQSQLSGPARVTPRGERPWTQQELQDYHNDRSYKP